MVSYTNYTTFLRNYLPSTYLIVMYLSLTHQLSNDLGIVSLTRWKLTILQRIRHTHSTTLGSLSCSLKIVLIVIADLVLVLVIVVVDLLEDSSQVWVSLTVSYPKEDRRDLREGSLLQSYTSTSLPSNNLKSCGIIEKPLLHSFDLRPPTFRFETLQDDRLHSHTSLKRSNPCTPPCRVLSTIDLDGFLTFGQASTSVLD